MLHNLNEKWKEQLIAKEEGKKVSNPFSFAVFKVPAKVVEVLSTVELVRNKDNKINTTLTVKGIKDREQKAAFELSFVVNRSDLLKPKSAAQVPEYASLTPLFMYAHKKHHGVMYEEWDKTDENLSWSLGKFLLPLRKVPVGINEWLAEQNIKEMRELFLGENLITSYRGKGVEMAGTKFPAGSPITKILLQTWIANVKTRVPGAMILDVENWDNVPEPYDLFVEEPKVETKKKTKPEVNMPW